MGMHSAPGSGIVQAPASNIEEVSEFSINNLDILEKLAKIAGCEVKDFPANEFAELKEMAKNGKDSEWYNGRTGVKFFMDRDGSLTIGNKSPEAAIKRAKEMGM